MSGKRQPTADQNVIAEAVTLIAEGKADEAQPLLQAAEEIRQAAEKNAPRDKR